MSDNVIKVVLADAHYGCAPGCMEGAHPSCTPLGHAPAPSRAPQVQLSTLN